MSQLTDFERGRIIGRWEAGESTRNIASALHHSQSQVTHAIQAFKGRPSALNDRDVRQAILCTEKDKDI
ncbi:6718_t:CDS:2 [Entrophospora sp. SA101]|nr:6718_t:CDS:2 [Entrophospora sp. SA101]